MLQNFAEKKGTSRVDLFEAFNFLCKQSQHHFGTKMHNELFVSDKLE